MSLLDTMLEDQPLCLRERPHPSDIDQSPSITSKQTLESALSLVVVAVAALYRAGPSFKRRSEALWVWAAGSWDRECYDRRVVEAGKALTKMASVEQDREFAESKVMEAVELLRKEADWRDAMDLKGAFRAYMEGD